MSNNERIFLALEEGLYNGQSLEEVITLTCQKLMEIGTIDAINRSNFLKRYYEIGTKESYHKMMESSFKTIITHLKKSVLKDVPFEIAIRIKSLVSVWQKAEKIAKEGRDYSEILDILGMRIILEDMDEYRSAEKLAEVANEILDFSVEKKWSITPLTMKVDNFNPELYPKIVIPTNDVKEMYIHYRKNYSRFPKENGYQSIHLNIMPQNKVHTEVQIRTWQEHDHCENPYIAFKDLNHEAYKAKEYEDSKLNYRIEDVKSIRLGHTGFILDPFGITKPRILVIHKHVPF